MTEPFPFVLSNFTFVLTRYSWYPKGIGFFVTVLNFRLTRFLNFVPDFMYSYIYLLSHLSVSVSDLVYQDLSGLCK